MASPCEYADIGVGVVDRGPLRDLVQHALNAVPAEVAQRAQPLDQQRQPLQRRMQRGSAHDSLTTKKRCLLVRHTLASLPVSGAPSSGLAFIDSSSVQTTCRAYMLTRGTFGLDSSRSWWRSLLRASSAWPGRVPPCWRRPGGHPSTPGTCLHQENANRGQRGESNGSQGTYSGTQGTCHTFPNDHLLMNVKVTKREVIRNNHAHSS